MKHIPKEKRPDEKCMRFGAEFLSDAELLAVIIRSGTYGKKSIDVADEILRLSGHNLLGLCHLSVQDLQKISGIGTVKAIQLKCVYELSKRIAKTTYQNGITMTSPKSIADYYMESMRHEHQERIVVAMFDSKNKLISDKIISIGTVNATFVTPREIYITALNCEAVYIVLLHNHPSGDPTPSKEDLVFTKRIFECGKMLGIQLVDHLIIGDNSYVSFREKELI